MVDGVAIPLSPTARQSLDLALDAAFELGDGKIDTGHLLVGIICQGRRGEGVAAWILSSLKVEYKSWNNGLGSVLGLIRLKTLGVRFIFTQKLTSPATSLQICYLVRLLPF